MLENAELLFGLARVANALRQDEAAARLISTALEARSGADTEDGYVTGPRLEAA